jgi:hypothetical protein
MRPTKSGRIRLKRETKGNRLEDRHCETLSRHEGLAPVRSPKARSLLELFQADVFLPEIGSIAVSLQYAPRACSWTRGFLFAGESRTRVALHRSRRLSKALRDP